MSLFSPLDSHHSRQNNNNNNNHIRVDDDDDDDHDTFMVTKVVRNKSFKKSPSISPSKESLPYLTNNQTHVTTNTSMNNQFQIPFNVHPVVVTPSTSPGTGANDYSMHSLENIHDDSIRTNENGHNNGAELGNGWGIGSGIGSDFNSHDLSM